MSFNDPGTTQAPAGNSAASTNSGKSEPLEASATAKLASAAHSAVDVAATNLEKAEHALREAHPGKSASDAVLSFSETFQDTVKAYVHQYPLRSVGIGLAAGYLLTLVLKK